MESLSVGAPMVICPGFGDQAANAAKAQSLNVGVKVDRPINVPAKGGGGGGGSGGDSALVEYEARVAAAVQQVMGASHQTFLATAGEVAKELQKAGGVEKAVQIVAKAAGRKST